MQTPPPSPIVLSQRAQWLAADTDTPISLFMGAAPDGAPGILLESAEVDGRWGRYSVLGCDPALFASCRGGNLTLHIEDERLAPLTALEGLPFVEGLRALMRGVDIRPDARGDSLPPITRALYGYMGFGMAGLFNPTLAPAIPPDDAEACFMLPRTVLLFDHMYHRLCQISLDEHKPLRGVHPSMEEPPPHVAPVLTQPDGPEYEARVARVREELRRGEAIQVVLSMRRSTPFAGDPLPLYRRMRRCNASPYMFFLRLPDVTLFGASPEVMVRCEGDGLRLSPIAGTRPRGKDAEEDCRLAAELYADAKERAEHVMLVDLGRNDLGRVARPGSVAVERNMEVERFSHVMHLTSRVRAQLRQGLDALDVLAATFPAGTLSGAPKLRAMEIIAATEKLPRGPYAGCVGWLGLDKDSVHLDTGIIIRSMWLRDGILHWQAGAGIVFDSVPALEAEECRHKAAIMNAVLNIQGE